MNSSSSPNFPVEKYIPQGPLKRGLLGFVPAESTLRFRVIQPVIIAHEGVAYTVPVDFKSDFSSIPRIAFSIIPPHGITTRASIIHDFLYTYRIGENLHGPELARYYADLRFLIDLLADRTPPGQAFAMFCIVRAFGASAWKKDQTFNQPPL